MSGESPARDGGLLDRRHEFAAAPRAGRSPWRRAASAAAGTAALLAGLGGLAACGPPAPGVTVRPPVTASQRLPLSPIPGQLIGVSAGPDGSAWAAGSTTSGPALIVRWNGAAWSRAASPSPGRDALLLGVSAGPGGTAWAVGDSCMSRCGTTSAVYRMLILHWDGKAWSLVTGPGLGSDAYLYGVSAGPGGSAWAVGYICTSGCHTASEADQMLVLRWDGTSWSQAAAPGLGSSALLDAVSAGADGTAWAVGSSCTPGCLAPRAATRALILPWDGTAWSQAASPSPAGKAILTGVSAGPGGGAWAAGYTRTPGCL